MTYLVVAGHTAMHANPNARPVPLPPLDHAHSQRDHDGDAAALLSISGPANPKPLKQQPAGVHG